MPSKSLPRIASVAVGAARLTLHIRWNTGDAAEIDVSGLVNAFRFYAPLRQDPELFRQVRVGEHGTDIVWPGELDMSNDTLWRLAREQSGAGMTAETLQNRREANN